MRIRSVIFALAAFAVMTTASRAAAPGSDFDPESWPAIWRSYDVDPAIAESVVWPELQYYSGLRDVMETAANYGGMDLSIGIFQMKPSFVEELETAWGRSGMAERYQLFFDTSDTAAARRKRLNRMRDDEWQVRYIALFLRLLYDSYGSFNDAGVRVQNGLETLPIEDQVRLAANAYNRGCAWADSGCGSVDSLRVNAYEEQFPRVVIPTSATRQYCYSTLAWEHYQDITGKP